MIKLYTLESIEQSKIELKKYKKVIGISLSLFALLSLLFVIFRNEENHFPSIVLLSIIWTLGIWALMTSMFLKVLPLNRDICFGNKMLLSEKKEITGWVSECIEEITMQRIPCYILKINTKENEKQRLYQVYLDKRFYSDKIRAGKRVRIQIAQHFVTAYEMGGDCHE